MATVQNLLNAKSSDLLSIAPHATVLEAAVLMNDQRIGALLVVVGDRIEGIFTERDILRRVVAEQRDPQATTVEEVMTRNLVCCTPGTAVEKAKVIFHEKRIRHLPVIDVAGRPVGMISIGDVNAWALDNQRVEITYLQEYIYGTQIRGAGYAS